ncbi:APOSPORY-ASSOCIATED PROTEIN C-RELATED [Salix koriyanagi]|uniref:APOSPORY-ASSOCIATED PROTEIN C-RELATED n=1 Tax=Salix koriyanagi TaxID=2511006 RepID=A0A9Q0W2B0_9ROSI|nr:APOSPORY-ASSOCIATED PROTEIN C-RELATED [Salix koriyanagi]
MAGSGSERAAVELCKGINGLDKVVLRGPRGSSAEVYFEVRVEGLETLDYLDNLENKERFTEQGDALTFESEVDKVYLGAPTKIAILDHEKKRTFVLRKDGLPDAVVWNPWDKKAKTMTDFGDDEYMHMLCVEAAAAEKPITLKPGEEWKGRLELSAVPSSYCSGQLDPQKVLQSS